MRVDVSSLIRAVWLSPGVKQYGNRYLSQERSLARGSELADYRYACKYPHPTVSSVRLLLYRLPHNVTRFACVMCVVMIVAC